MHQSKVSVNKRGGLHCAMRFALSISVSVSFAGFETIALAWIHIYYWVELGTRLYCWLQELAIDYTRTLQVQ